MFRTRIKYPWICTKVISKWVVGNWYVAQDYDDDNGIASD